MAGPSYYIRAPPDVGKTAMIFKISLYLSLIVFGLGLLFKVSTWFRYHFAGEVKPFTLSERLMAATGGILSTLFSGKVFTLLKVLVLDVFCQRRILRESRLRWAMHMSLFWGFTLLLLMHALEGIVTSNLFEDYAATLNPFLFLRNFFALLVFVGIGIACYRRFVQKAPRFFTNVMDRYALILVAVIMMSGIFLEAAKIGSFERYLLMVTDYADFDDEQDLKALEAYWVEDFGLVSPNVTGHFEEGLLDRGRELHEMSCAACHSRPQWAFISYAAATALRPAAAPLDRAGLATLLWYIHFLACFIGLAYLPFSRMFHILVSPVSLLANSVMERGKSHPANVLTRQIMELDACTHCGTCTARCSVAVTYEEIPNPNILPSEKIASLKALASGRPLSERQMAAIQEGLYLCTNCYRCTPVCPVGINLQDLWFNVREAVLKQGYPELLVLTPFSMYRGLMSPAVREEDYLGAQQRPMAGIEAVCTALSTPGEPIESTHMDRDFKKRLLASANGSTFSYCFTCTTCTSACPVVRSYKNPPEALGLTPHQIIRATALGLPDLIFRSKMLWYCLGCYQCQDSCPQAVRVADVLYELKNLAVARMKNASRQSGERS
jgi:heterodisulfide reductase subunit C/nitrate reductase gamma subunit